MEVACSFDEFAQVLADDGYIHGPSYFNDGADLPAMLRVFDSKTTLDSPESFPESPCSDEDIARVLEITQMSSPSLLESCIPDSFDSLPPTHNNLLDPHNGTMTKTRDPCITNAVLHDIFSNSPTANFQGRPVSSLDGFCLPPNVFNNSVSVNLNHIIDVKENDTISTSYFDSTPVLSPLSDVDHLPEPLLNYQEQTHQAHLNPSIVEVNLDNINAQHTSGTITGNTGTNQVYEEPPVVNSTQKRKRKRKSFSKSSKSKKTKNKTTNPSPKPQPKTKKAKISNEKHSEKQANSQSNKRQNNFKTVTSESLVPRESPDTIGSTSSDHNEGTTLRRSSRSTRNTENYNFRLTSLVKRVETEKRQQEPKQPKGKAKPPPLSKYRRRTANARERDRMKEINDAFDTLKESLPEVEDESKQKATKFTILKLALNYISALRDMLGYDELDPSSASFDISSFQNDISTENMDAESSTDTETVDYSPSNLLAPSNLDQLYIDPSQSKVESSPSSSNSFASSGSDST